MTRKGLPLGGRKRNGAGHSRGSITEDPAHYSNRSVCLPVRSRMKNLESILVDEEIGPRECRKTEKKRDPNVEEASHLLPRWSC